MQDTPDELLGLCNWLHNETRLHHKIYRESSYTCYDANAIPIRSQYAGTYAAAIAGRYGWEGLGGQGMGCEWLAGLVWEGLGGLGMGCEWLAGLVSRVCIYMDWRGWEVWG